MPFILSCALSTVVLFTPESGVPTAPPGTDKVVHLVLFAVLAATGVLARVPALPLLAWLTGYAALSEVLQAVLPLGRHGDLADAVTDVAGIALGWVLTGPLPSRLRRQRHRWRR